MQELKDTLLTSIDTHYYYETILVDLAFLSAFPAQTQYVTPTNKFATSFFLLEEKQSARTQDYRH
jgi:hypothetical protein